MGASLVELVVQVELIRSLVDAACQAVHLAARRRACRCRSRRAGLLRWAAGNLMLVGALAAVLLEVEVLVSEFLGVVQLKELPPWPPWLRGSKLSCR